MSEVTELHEPFIDWLKRTGVLYRRSRSDRKTSEECGEPDFSLYSQNRSLFIEFKDKSSGKIDGWRKEMRDYVRRTPLAGINPNSKRLVFWNEFQDQMREANPSMNEDEIMVEWRKKYGQ